MILKKEAQQIENFDWGRLYWYASSQLGNSKHLTLGQCIIKKGCQNPVHFHPNCEEVLYVLKGMIKHTYENKSDVILNEGDSIVIPEDIKHCAINIGDTDAVLMISFSSGDRKTIVSEVES